MCAHTDMHTHPQTHVITHAKMYTPHIHKKIEEDLQNTSLDSQHRDLSTDVWYKKTAKAQDPEPDFGNLSTTLAVCVRLFTALYYRQSNRKHWE